MNSKRIDKKISILNAAIALFHENGVENVSTRDLTERLGLARSHIYYYFKDWLTLTVEALSTAMETELESFYIATRNLEPEDKIKCLVESYLDTEDTGTTKFYTSLWKLAKNNQEYALLGERMNDKWEDFLVKAIQQGIFEGKFHKVDNYKCARQINALLNGYYDLISVNPCKKKFRSAVEDVFDLINILLGTDMKI